MVSRMSKKMKNGKFNYRQLCWKRKLAAPISGLITVSNGDPFDTKLDIKLLHFLV